MSKRIAIEIGGTKLQAALGDASGAIETVRRTPAEPEKGHGSILENIRKLVEPLLSPAVDRIGVGFGGPVDASAGRTVKSHQVPGWDNFPLADWATQRFGRPCALENDTNCGGLAEALAGAGRGGRCVFYSNIGSGIGGAIVIDGKLHNGRYGAGEVGHAYVWDPHAQQYDIVEHLCSGWALGRRAKQLARAGELPRLLELAGGNPENLNAYIVGAALAMECGQAGMDEPSIQQAGMDEAALDEAGRLMDELTATYAVALANVIALINPDRIVIGGGVSLIGRPLFGRLERELRRICFAPYRDNWQLLPAALGENVVLAGALML